MAKDAVANLAAYLQWVSAVLSSGEGVFWIDKNGWKAGTGAMNSTHFGAKNSFFWTDFTGEKMNSVAPEFLFDTKKPFLNTPVDIEKLPSFRLQKPLESYSNIGKERYEKAVVSVKNEAKNGNIWVLNLAQKLSGELKNPLSLLRFFAHYLKKYAPKTGGIVWTKNEKFVCMSPEIFITQSEKTLETFPIKGTGSREYLEKNEKEIAELRMVTDLLRNDLGQISTSVSALSERKLTPRGEFFHAHSHISAQLKTGQLTKKMYQKLLPAGSVSGAPKRSVCQVISKSETAERALYCGTFGHFETPQKMQSLLLIRTLFANGSRWEYGTGAGITHLSDPKAEWKETLTKAEILLQCSS